MDYKDICLKTNSLVLEVGEFIRNERGTLNRLGVEKKGRNDFVTYVDKEAEKLLVKGLSEILPQSGFVTEEETIQKKGKIYNWIIDPIDGTTNFIHGLAPHAISVALKEYGETVVGIVYEIAMDECFYTYKGGKAFCNGNHIAVSDKRFIDDSLIATGFPYNDFSRMESFIESMKYFMKNSHGLRRIGSAATDLAYVACGRFEGFYEYSLKPWDVAAGAFLVEQAGGKVCDFKGGDKYLYGGEIIAANGKVFDDFSNVIIELMS